MSSTTLDLVVSTHAALLRVAVNCETGRADVTVLHDACPVYFGLTACAGGMLIAARNVGLDFRVATPGLPCNAIWRLADGATTPEPYIAHPALFDLHQIHAVGNWLFVVMGWGSRLAVFDIAARRLLGSFDLQSVVPPDLRRTDRPRDRYHFNSISFAGGRLFVLAHNWEEGSFALELRLDPASREVPVLTPGPVHRDLGHASHDIAFDEGTLFFLDGEGGALVARGHPAGRAGLPGRETRPYPRGLVVMRDRVIVGYGSWSAEHGERAASPTRLCVFGRERLDVRLDLDLGPFGNPCALSLAVAGPGGGAWPAVAAN